MKIRLGFVSNSSSSSYIIALRKTSQPCPVCGRSDPDLLDIIGQSSYTNDDNKISYRGEEIKESSEWAYLKEKEKDQIEKCLKDKEWEVADILISYHDETLKIIFNNAVKSGNAVIIHGESE